MSSAHRIAALSRCHLIKINFCQFSRITTLRFSAYLLISRNLYSLSQATISQVKHALGFRGIQTKEFSNKICYISNFSGCRYLYRALHDIIDRILMVKHRCWRARLSATANIRGRPTRSCQDNWDIPRAFLAKNLRRKWMNAAVQSLRNQT